jgi:predicted RND superfamily exporter protein
MKSITFIFVLSFIGLTNLSFSQSTERYQTTENYGPKPSDFYKIMFDFKDIVITKENVSMLENINLKDLFAKAYEDQDVEIFLEEIQKTIIIFSRAKTESLMETHYNHTANFIPLYN